MPSFTVIWEIEFDADSPQAAAKLSLEAMRDPESLATVFDVTDDETGEVTRVDLAEEKEK